MSNYDPFRIYNKRSKSSHKGQVLRKKIPNWIGYCFTDEELERAINSLEARGYHIYRPGVSSPQTIIKSDVYVISLGNLTFQNLNDTFSLQFSTLWNLIFFDFYNFLQIDPVRTSNVLFGIDILSINLYGRFQLPNAINNAFDLNFYFFDPNSPIDITNQQVSLAADSYSNIFSIQSSTHNNLLGIYKVTDYNNVVRGIANVFQKQEATNSPYLYTIIRQQPAILTALRTQDYNTFDPILFNVQFTGAVPGPLSISHSNYTVRVYLQYDI